MNPVNPADDPNYDHYGECKDALLMGYIEPDGTPAEPSEPDFTAATDAWAANTPDPWGEDPF